MYWRIGEVVDGRLEAAAVEKTIDIVAVECPAAASVVRGLRKQWTSRLKALAVDMTI